VRKSVREISVLILKLNVMKELSFEQMEEVKGGMTYCELVSFWYHGGGGYYGSQEMLIYAARICGLL
jgi:hypothetical protein